MKSLAMGPPDSTVRLIHLNLSSFEAALFFLMASLRRGESSSFLLCRSSAISFLIATTASCRWPCVSLPWFLRLNPLVPNHIHWIVVIVFAVVLPATLLPVRAGSCVVRLFTWRKETRGDETLLRGCDDSRIPLEIFSKLHFLCGSRCSAGKFRSLLSQTSADNNDNTTMAPSRMHFSSSAHENLLPNLLTGSIC